MVVHTNGYLSRVELVYAAGAPESREPVKQFKRAAAEGNIAALWKAADRLTQRSAPS